MSLAVFFDIPFVYYIPQYLPVIQELKKRNLSSQAVIYSSVPMALRKVIVDLLGIPCHWVKDNEAAVNIYNQYQLDWVVFGHGFDHSALLNCRARTALLFHGSGTGVKRASLSPGLAEFTVRFVSGPARIPLFRQHFPAVEMVEVGFAKLDPLFKPGGMSAERLDLEALGLSRDKPTILYAPTFYPSSIENMPSTFARDFADYNILIKAHDFTLSKARYCHQFSKLKHWSQEPNVYLAKPEEFSLIPFMATADLMITDTSSAIFEFAALNKPVVICKFVKLRWTYCGPFKYRLRKRIDSTTTEYQQVAASAINYRELVKLVKTHMATPTLLESVRLNYRDQIMGNTDGNASSRIVDYLEHNKSKEI